MQEITLLQGILLAITAVIVGLDYWLEALFIFRPIIVSTITGIILGDLQLGLISGGIAELAFAGLTPAGGTQPPNPVLAGFMTPIIAYTAGIEPTAALGLALPFSFLMQYIILFFYSSFSFFMSKADAAAAKADTASIARINITTCIIVMLSYGVVVFVSSYVAQDVMATFVNSLPIWLTHGLEVAGGILPAVGFGMLLRIMMKTKYIPYLLAGFIFACFIPFSNLLPVALMGTAFGLYDYFNAKARRDAIKEAQIIATSTTGGTKNVGI